MLSTRRQLLARASGVLILPLLAACAQADTGGGAGTQRPPSPTPTAAPSPTAEAGRIAHPTGADELVLRIDRTGGLLPPFHIATELPLFVLYGDGSVITQGPQIMIYPPPALPNLLVTGLTEEGMQAILREAEIAGLLEGDRRYEFPVIADAPVTIFTVNAGGRTSVVSAYALIEAEVDDPKIPMEEREARRRLREFLDKALSLSSWLPRAAIALPERAYTIERLQLIVLQADEAIEEPTDVEPSELDWPLSAALAEFGSPYQVLGRQARCGVVEREELAAVVDAMSKANTLTRWRSDGTLFVIFPRPLLPDETGCVQR